MGWIKAAVAAAVLAAAVAGCKKDDDGPDTARLIRGTWDTEFAASDRDTDRVLIEAEKTYFPTSSHVTYAFSDSGTLVVNDGTAVPDVYLWSIVGDGTTLRLVARADSASRLYYHLYRLTDKALVLEDTSANGRLSWIGMVK